MSPFFPLFHLGVRGVGTILSPPILAHPSTPMSSKHQKMTAKRGRASEEPTCTYDQAKFVNEGAAEKFGLICKNRSFIKETGFHHPEDIFRKNIVAKGWQALCQSPRPDATSVVQEFYSNLAFHVVKQVRVRNMLVDFSARSINQYYHLDPVPHEPFDRLHEQPNYPEVIRVLTNGQGDWKLNSDGLTGHFQAKHLAYIPKVWHQFIISCLIPTSNVCEVTAKRALINYAILQDNPFDVGQVIEDAILHNWDAKMNLEHPFLIYGLCKQVGVPLEDNEAWIHPIKAIMVKRDKLGVPRPDAMYDSGNEPSDEDELREYQARFGLPIDPPSDVGQSSSHPPPPPPSSHPPPPQPSQKEDLISPSTILEDPVLDLTTHFEAYWDETQGHCVLISQDVEAL